MSGPVLVNELLILQLPHLPSYQYSGWFKPPEAHVSLTYLCQRNYKGRGFSAHPHLFTGTGATVSPIACDKIHQFAAPAPK